MDTGEASPCVPSEHWYLVRRLAPRGAADGAQNAAEQLRLEDVPAQADISRGTKQFTRQAERCVAYDVFGRRQWKARPLIEAEMQYAQPGLSIGNLPPDALVGSFPLLCVTILGFV